MNRYTWEGHTIDVRFVLQARVGWLGGGFVVRVDGGDDVHPPKGFESGGTATRFQIDHNGKMVPGVVRSVGRARALGTGYEVDVDGQIVAKETMRAENWFIPYSIFAGILGILLYLFWRTLV